MPLLIDNKLIPIQKSEELLEFILNHPQIKENVENFKKKE